MQFSNYGSRSVLAAFDGGEITSDAGLLLLRERARQVKLFERMAGCFVDHREPARVIHTLPDLLAQRVSAMALGYEDIVDHDTLRFDPAFKLLATPKAHTSKTQTLQVPRTTLAGKSTLNRLEQCDQTGKHRYHQIAPKLNCVVPSVH